MPSLRSGPGRALPALQFVLVSALAGLLVVGLALPLLGAAAWASRATATSLDDIAVVLDAPAQSQRSQVLDANGDVLASFYAENRVYVGLDDIAPVMQ